MTVAELDALPKEKIINYEHKLTCAACQQKVKQIYQYNLCKKCLVNQFRRLIKIIDSVRR